MGQGFIFTVEVRAYDGRPLSREEFDAAVRYLKREGYRYDGSDAGWVSTLEAQLPKRQPGENLVGMLRRHNIEVRLTDDVRPFYAFRDHLPAPWSGE